jgi:hypothetical protein
MRTDAIAAPSSDDSSTRRREIADRAAVAGLEGSAVNWA